MCSGETISVCVLLALRLSINPRPNLDIRVYPSLVFLRRQTSAAVMPAIANRKAKIEKTAVPPITIKLNKTSQTAVFVLEAEKDCRETAVTPTLSPTAPTAVYRHPPHHHNQTQQNQPNGRFRR